MKELILLSETSSEGERINYNLIKRYWVKRSLSQIFLESDVSEVEFIPLRTGQDLIMKVIMQMKSDEKHKIEMLFNTRTRKNELIKIRKMCRTSNVPMKERW